MKRIVVALITILVASGFSRTSGLSRTLGFNPTLILRAQQQQIQKLVMDLRSKAKIEER